MVFLWWIFKYTSKNWHCTAVIGFIFPLILAAPPIAQGYPSVTPVAGSIVSEFPLRNFSSGGLKNPGPTIKERISVLLPSVQTGKLGSEKSLCTARWQSHQVFRALQTGEEASVFQHTASRYFWPRFSELCVLRFNSVLTLPGYLLTVPPD